MLLVFKCSGFLEISNEFINQFPGFGWHQIDVDKLSPLTSDSQNTGWKGILATKISTGLLLYNA